MDELNVLHIGNIAGVPAHLSQILNEQEKINAKWIARKNQDLYGFNKYYKEKGKGFLIGGERAVWFYLFLAFYILTKRPNVIHLHAWLEGLWMVNIFKKMYIIRKPYVIFHGHGSEIRSKVDKLIPLLSKADKLIVCTTDLKDEINEVSDLEVMYIPNPIDSNLFYNNNTNKKNTVLFIRNFLPLVYPYDYMDKVKEFTGNMKLMIIDRMSDHDLSNPFPNSLTFGDFVPFSGIGDLFRQYEYFLDFKSFEPVFSKAAVEASRCGCKIVHESFKIYQPEELDHLDGTDKFIRLYKQLQGE